MKEEDKVFHTCSFMNPKIDNDTVLKMLDFLEDFDPIQLKYSPNRYKIIEQNEDDDPRVPSDIRDVLIKYDNTYNFETNNKESYSSIKDNLYLVYGSSKVVENDIRIFNCVEEKMISQYLAIPQLTKMFDEDYFQFEWDMHVAQNFREHRNNYQRDHFIHQIRDMYSILILLGEHGFYEACVKVLKEKNASPVSLFTQKKLLEFMKSQKGINSIFKDFRKDICGYFDPQYTDLEESLAKYKEKYFLKYVIYASSILCSLFHDMGYPICHFLETRNRTSQYNPTMYMFVRNEVESFDHIASLLSSSLLFTVVSREDIKESMQKRPNGTYNHGAYSAIAFLMQFYNSGIIFSLPKEKQCAIELAALAIYNHTLAYKIVNNKENTYYQPLFKQNPISFMLRLCDDLQEWNRRYFVVSEESDIPVCSKCFTPSIAQSDGTKAQVTYRCMCSSNDKWTPPSTNIDYNSFRYYNFYNRKLYLVSTCDYMTSSIVGDSDSKKALCFHINYDYYRLLNVTRINPTYAKFRLSELNDLKEVIKDQDYRNLFGFDFIYLDYFMTANPLTIKIKILEEYIKINSNKHVRDVKLDNIIAQETAVTEEKKLRDLMSIKIKSDVDTRTLFEFYKDLLYQANELRKGNGHITESVTDFMNNWFSTCSSSYYRQIMKNLITESFEQYAKDCTLEDSLCSFDTDIFQKKYKNQYAPSGSCEDALYDSVIAYCNSENDYNCYDKNIDKNQMNYISYFADLYFFEWMNRDIQKKYINSPQ